MHLQKVKKKTKQLNLSPKFNRQTRKKLLALLLFVNRILVALMSHTLLYVVVICCLLVDFFPSLAFAFMIACAIDVVPITLLSFHFARRFLTLRS